MGVCRLSPPSPFPAFQPPPSGADCELDWSDGQRVLQAGISRGQRCRPVVKKKFTLFDLHSRFSKVLYGLLISEVITELWFEILGHVLYKNVAEFLFRVNCRIYLVEKVISRADFQGVYWSEKSVDSGNSTDFFCIPKDCIRTKIP